MSEILRNVVRFSQLLKRLDAQMLAGERELPMAASTLFDMGMYILCIYHGMELTNHLVSSISLHILSTSHHSSLFFIEESIIREWSLNKIDVLKPEILSLRNSRSILHDAGDKLVQQGLSKNVLLQLIAGERTRRDANTHDLSCKSSTSLLPLCLSKRIKSM